MCAGSDSSDHVQIKSQTGYGFFVVAGYSHIEDHENKTWTPSTAMSEAASVRTELTR
jgi:hypothetical protein